MIVRLSALAEARAEQRRQAIAGAARATGVEDVAVEGQLIRLRGAGLMRRWLSDLSLREAGRGRR